MLRKAPGFAAINVSPDGIVGVVGRFRRREDGLLPRHI